MKRRTTKIVALFVVGIMISTMAPIESVYAKESTQEATESTVQDETGITIAEEYMQESEDSLQSEEISVSSQAADGEAAQVDELVHVGDVEVVYEDGTPVEDGVKFDLIDMVAAMSNGFSNIEYPERYKKVYTVKDGKLSGMEMLAERQYKIGFDTDNTYWNTLEVTGCYNSVKLMRIFARYEGKAPLYYDYDEGVNGEEIPVTQLVIHKIPDGTEVVATRPTSCIMQLLLVEGKDLNSSEYYAEGKHTFYLKRRDNGKTKTLYSHGSELTIIGDADIPYTLTLDENDTMYSMEPIDFSIQLDSYNYYQAVRDNYHKDDVNGYLTYDYVYMTRIDNKENEEKNPIYSEDCADSSYELVYRTEKVQMPELKILEATGENSTAALDKAIDFVFYNATTQSTEKTVTSKNGVLPSTELVKGQHYIIYANDTEYAMSNHYITLRTSDAYPTCDKCGDAENSFVLEKREAALSDLSSINRVKISLPVYDMTEAGNGDAVSKDVKFVLTSPLETVEATSKDGSLTVNLLEDNNYMVAVEDDTYAIESFPMTVKDKSEYGADKYAFNHFSCGSVGGLFLIEKGTEHDDDNMLVSASGKTSVTGVNFGGGSYVLNDRTLEDTVAALDGKDYEVIDVDCINMYRTELSRLAKGEFSVTRKVEGGKTVANVYYIDGNGELQNVTFKQTGDVVVYEMPAMSMYNNVIEYTAAEVDGQNPATTVVSPGKAKVKKVNSGKKKMVVTWKKVKGVTGYQIRYSKKSSMKSAKKATVKSKKATSKKIKGLKSKTKYYVQIRTYKKVGGKTYYSAWSAKKSVKVK